MLTESRGCLVGIMRIVSVGSLQHQDITGRSLALLCKGVP